MLDIIEGKQQQRTGRVGEWLRRYVPAELLSLTTTLIASWGAFVLTHNLLLAALAGTLAESLAYYGLIVARDLWAQRRSVRAMRNAMGDLVIEFGPAELLDSVVIRPAALYAALALLPSPLFGALVGKLAADIYFYLPTISCYELLRRRRAARKENGRAGRL